jgi:hypothetical protein
MNLQRWNTEEEIVKAIERAVLDERKKHVIALADLDFALCQFLNNAADEYDPRVWLPSIRRDFASLSRAYNECHVMGTMDLQVSADEYRKRGHDNG